MRKLFGIGKPRCLQGLGPVLDALWSLLQRLLDRSEAALGRLSEIHTADRLFRACVGYIYPAAAKS